MTFSSPADLARLRQGLDLSMLAPVDDPSAWTLHAVDPAGRRHAWEHVATKWLTQTLTMPRALLEDPSGARAHRQAELAAETRVRELEAVR